MRAVICLLIFFIEISLNYGTPPLIQNNCSTWDSACLTARAQSLVSDCIDKLDPMCIDLIHIVQGGLKFDMRDVNIEGFKNAIIDNVSVDVNSTLLRVKFHTDLSINSSYTASGCVFSLPIHGDGNFRMSYDNVFIEIFIPFEITKDVQGKDVMNLQKEYTYSYDARGAGKFHLDNLCDQKGLSSEKMHEIINQNWKAISVMYGKHLFDKINDKIFEALHSNIHSQSSENISSHTLLKLVI